MSHQVSAVSPSYKRHTVAVVQPGADMAVTAFEKKLDLFAKQITSLEGRVRTAPLRDRSTSSGVLTKIRQDCKRLAEKVEGLMAEGLEKSCARNTPGAMDVFEGATLLVDKLAEVQHLCNVGVWDETQTQLLCESGGEDVFLGKTVLLNPEGLPSITSFVQKLNAVQMDEHLEGSFKHACDTGMCAAFCESEHAYFLFYRSDKETAADRAFGLLETRARRRWTSFDD